MVEFVFDGQQASRRVVGEADTFGEAVASIGIAVLDFGFFSSGGSPVFDAVVTANIFDIYGPDNVASRHTMEQLIQEAFAYPPEALAVYLAAYALATMNLVGSSERDGHFHWCAEVLRRGCPESRRS